MSDLELQQRKTQSIYHQESIWLKPAQLEREDAQRTTYTRIVFIDEKKRGRTYGNKDQEFKYKDFQSQMCLKGQSFNNLLKINSLNKHLHPQEQILKQSHNIFINEVLNNSLDFKKKSEPRPKSACINLKSNPQRKKSFDRRTVHSASSKNTCNLRKISQQGKKALRIIGSSHKDSRECKLFTSYSNVLVPKRYTNQLSSYIGKSRLTSYRQKQLSRHSRPSSPHQTKRNLNKDSDKSQKQVIFTCKDLLNNISLVQKQNKPTKHKNLVKKGFKQSNMQNSFAKQSFSKLHSQSNCNVVKNVQQTRQQKQTIQKGHLQRDQDSKHMRLHNIWTTNANKSEKSLSCKKNRTTKKSQQWLEVSQPYLYIEQIQFQRPKKQREYYNRSINKPSNQIKQATEESFEECRQQQMTKSIIMSEGTKQNKL